MQLNFKGKFIAFYAYIIMKLRLNINDLSISKGKEKENTRGG